MFFFKHSIFTLKNSYNITTHNLNDKLQKYIHIHVLSNLQTSYEFIHSFCLITLIFNFSLPFLILSLKFYSFNLNNILIIYIKKKNNFFINYTHIYIVYFSNSKISG